jgi:anti-sigma regulatory factor (Ser/Thr protein kinase)
MRGFPGPFTIHFISDPKLLTVVRGVVAEVTTMVRFSDQDAHRLMLGLDEALTNVIKHAYNGAHDKPIDATFTAIVNESGRLGVRVNIRDQGNQVDQDKIHGRDLKDLRPGGLGVHLMKSMLDRVEYIRRPEGGTELVLEKFPSEDSADEANQTET